VTWAQNYTFSEPLRDVREEADEAARLRAELLQELSPGHLLHGLDLHVIARAIPQDEVVVETADGRVALVHITWSGHAEAPPWPTAEVLDSAEHLQNALQFRY
jgi:hypothetical protein